MTSQIYYKFKSAKDYDNITFDGLGISVFDAKKEILTAKKLKGNDFDIVVTHAESGEDYQEDTAIIPRNTPIVVRRVPTKPGKGTAHRYLEGVPAVSRNAAAGNRINYGNTNGSMSKTFDSSKQQQQMQVSRPSPIPTITLSSGEEQTEEDKIAAMFAQSSEFWEKTQEQMASKPALRRPNQPRPQVKQQIQKALPPNYVCYRCGQKGHWIQACPTNGDRSFDHMKVRKTTGIPRSFLQKVEQVPPGGLLGKKFHARQKSYVTTNEVLEETLPVPPELQCMICARLLREAVITPCCQASFCDECIRNALISTEQEDQQFKCPNCQTQLSPDGLLPDKATREAVNNHLRDWARRRNEQIVPEEASTSSDTLVMEKDQQPITTDLIDHEQPPKVKTEPVVAKVELPKKPIHELPQIPPPQQSTLSQQSQLPQVPSQQSQQSSQFQQSQQQLQRQQHQFSNANGKTFPQQNPSAAQQATYGQFGYYNDYGFGYDQGYWYDDAGYPQMSMNMMNAPGGYYDPSYFESGFYPADHFPAPQQFMPPFRPPVYDDFWDNRPMIPPQGNFTPFGNNVGGGMGGTAIQPFRGGGFRGGFAQRGGNFQNRGRGGGGGGRGRSTSYFYEQRPFNSGHGSSSNDFRRESSMSPSVGRREASERPEYREGEQKYEEVDDFGRDLARRKSLTSPDKDSREKLTPPLLPDRDRRDRDIIADEDLDSRRREKARSHSRSRSKERRSSSRSRHRTRKPRDELHRSRSPSKHDHRILFDDRRKNSTSSRRSRDGFMERKEDRRYGDERRVSDDRRYYDDRRYSIPDRRDERRESISDRRSDRDRDNRRDDRRDSYNSSRYESRRLSNERYDDQEKARTPSPNNMMNYENDNENGENLYQSPRDDFDVEMHEKNDQSEPTIVQQNYEDNERQSRSDSPKPIIDTEEFQVSSTKDDRPTTPPSPDKFLDKRRHSSSHKHRSNKYHRSSHHRHESLDKEDNDRNSTSKSRHNPYPKDDYHRSGNRKHKKHHSSRHHSNRHRNSRSKDGETIRRRHYSRDRDERR
ncbi:15577_t:CDS:10 [Funneliformis caledonium]|uniref:15577_t:CDS:1 n=1 Tax=Funneliformis caledonium TaxID=1117310 RepID=A0A9N9C5J9_9GLOM|nr:15577_t:CDS:10 [Funneliformis caledonium]